MENSSRYIEKNVLQILANLYHTKNKKEKFQNLVNGKWPINIPSSGFEANYILTLDNIAEEVNGLNLDSPCTMRLNMYLYDQRIRNCVEISMIPGQLKKYEVIRLDYAKFGFWQ